MPLLRALYRGSLVITVFALGGCDGSSKSAATPTPAATATQAATTPTSQPVIVLETALPGTWIAERGAPGTADFALLTLVLRGDKSMSVSNMAAGLSVPVIADGVWKLDHANVILTLQKSDDGKPIGVELRQWTLEAGLKGPELGLRLLEPIKGPIFKKKTP